MKLTDEQWLLLEPLLPVEDRDPPGPEGGRPRRGARSLLDAVFWILRTGAPWADLPGRFPPYQTVHRRFQQWVADGTLERMLQALAEDLRQRGGLDLSECYIDGTHAGAKKGALAWDARAADWRPRSWPWQTVLVFLSPWGLQAVSAMKSRSSAPHSNSASSKRSRKN